MGCESANEGRQDRIGKNNQITVNESERALLECKVCRDKISQYIKRLEARKLKTRQKAKDFLRKGQRERAKLYLQQYKLHEKQIQVSDGQLSMITDQIMQIESSQNMQQCISCLKNGNAVLKKMQQDINIEEWEKVSDDLQDLKDKNEEIGDLLKEYRIDENQYNMEVEEEFNKLQAEVTGNSMNLPKVPQDTLPSSQIQVNNQKNRSSAKRTKIPVA